MAEQEDLKIRIEGGGQRATLTLTNGSLPDAIDAETLAGIARAEGVYITPEITARLQQICEELAEHPTAEPLTFAEATAPVHGTDGWIEWQEKFDSSGGGAEDAPAQNEAEAVDHYEVSSYLQVEADEVIGTLHAPTAGEDGMSVTGTSIAARPGKACRTSIDNRSIRTEADGRLIAIAPGVLKYDERSMSVVNMLDIPGYVDFSTGHVDFDGSVEIREGIRDRFKVRATKDVRVGGLVEAATIICGGNLSCQRGIAGRDRAQLLVGGDVSAGFLNNVRGRIAGDLTVRRELLNCDLAVGGQIQGDSACIIGGTLILTRGMVIGEIGSEAHPHTTIRMGEMPLLAQRIRQLETEIAEHDTEYQRLLDEQKQLQNRRNAIASERERITEIMFEVDAARQQRDESRQTRRRLLSLVRGQSGVVVRITKMLFSNTTFAIDDKACRVREDIRGPITISWNKHRALMYRIGDGDLRRLTDISVVPGSRAA